MATLKSHIESCILFFSGTMELQSGSKLSVVLEADCLIGLWRLPITHAFIFTDIRYNCYTYCSAQALS